MTSTDLVPQRWRTAAGTEIWPLRLTVARVAVIRSLYMTSATLYGQVLSGSAGGDLAAALLAGNGYGHHPGRAGFSGSGQARPGWLATHREPYRPVRAHPAAGQRRRGRLVAC